MHASRLVWRLAAISLLPLATFGTAAGEDDPYLAIKTNAAGTINYVRQSEIEAFADVSASNCILILTNGEDIRVFQNCASVAAGLQDKSLVSFPNDFGTVFVSSPLHFRFAFHQQFRLPLESAKPEVRLRQPIL